MDTGVLDFSNKKLILDYYFCLKSGPVFLFQIFIIAPLLLLIIDINKKKGEKKGGVTFICEFYS
jgi:hypothetical protein